MYERFKGTRQGKSKQGRIPGKGSRLYRIWESMVQRTTNPNDKDYSRYGGRGIKIARAWQVDYMNFARWALGSGYSGSLTIERVDYDGNYEPDNCTWIDRKEQANNRSTNFLVEYNGEKKTLMQWSEELELPYHTLYARLKKYGWTVDKAFTTR